MERETRIAWAAGFLDGEGCFFVGTRSDRDPSGSSHWRFMIEAAQTDIRPLEILQSLFGGVVCVKHKQKATWSKTWKWSLHQRHRIEECITTLRPFLVVKGEDADRLLSAMRHANTLSITNGRPLLNNSHCRHGHIYDETNTIIRDDGVRVCRACRIEAGRRHDLKRRGKRPIM